MHQKNPRPIGESLVICWGVFLLMAIGSWIIAIFFPSAVAYGFQFPEDQITQIHLIQSEQDFELYCYDMGEVPALLEDSEIPVREVEPVQFEAFLDGFSQVSCYKWANDPNPWIGEEIILITYADGSREWICWQGSFFENRTTQRQSMNWYYFNPEEFTAFWNSFAA